MSPTSLKAAVTMWPLVPDHFLADRLVTAYSERSEDEMAKAQWCGSYDAAQLLLDRCLRRDGSLFSESPDRLIWTADLAAELDGRMGSLQTRPRRASWRSSMVGLDGLDAEAIQLAAELVYVESAW